MYIYIYIYIVINSYVISRVNPYESTGCIAVFFASPRYMQTLRAQLALLTQFWLVRKSQFSFEKKSVAGEFFELNSVVFVKKKGGVTGEFLFLFNTVTAECWIILISLPVKQPQKPWFWPRDESVDEQLGDGIAMSRCSSFEHQLGWNVNFTLWLWLTSPWYRWPIEIDDFPS